MMDGSLAASSLVAAQGAPAAQIEHLTSCLSCQGGLRVHARPCRRCLGVGLTLRAGPAAAVDEASPLVAIVGAGIGGVALALALRQRGVRVRVFERDGSFAERRQGYGLTMQQGGLALAQLGVALHGGVQSASHFSFAPDGTVLGCYGRDVYAATRGGDAGVSVGRGRQNMHVPRQHLREALLTALGPGCIEWGARLETFEDHARGGVTLHMAGGTQVHAAVLVGADGVHSVVRRCKLGGGGGCKADDSTAARGGAMRASEGGKDPLRYLGLLVVLGLSELEHPVLSNRIIQTLDGTTRIYAMPFAPKVKAGDGGPPSSEEARAGAGDQCAEGSSSGPPDAHAPGFGAPSMPAPQGARTPHSSMWQLSFPATEADAAALSARGGAALLEEALRRCAAWHAPIPQLLRSTPAELVTGYPIYDRDPLPAALFRGHAASAVTLLGDAAHPMSPFKGQGANQALLDALSLARRIAQALQQTGAKDRIEDLIPRALADFEAEMLMRAGDKAAQSRENAAFLHSPAALSTTNCTRAAAARAAVRGEAGADVLTKAELNEARKAVEAGVRGTSA